MINGMYRTSLAVFDTRLNYRHYTLPDAYPQKIHKKGEYSLEIMASFWQFTSTKQNWCLRISGIRLLNQK